MTLGLVDHELGVLAAEVGFEHDVDRRPHPLLGVGTVDVGARDVLEPEVRLHAHRSPVGVRVVDGSDRGVGHVGGEDHSPAVSPVVLLSHDLWTRRYASDPNIVGKTVRVNGTDLTVIGVMPSGFRGLTGRSELWFPAVQAPGLTYPFYLTTNQDFISVVALLKPGSPIASLRAELETVGAGMVLSAS